VVHEVNLFDMAQKYADVSTTPALLDRLNGLTERAPAASGSSGAEAAR
jgi:maleamate amidohydrolase